MKYLKSFKIFEGQYSGEMNKHLEDIKSNCQPFISMLKKEMGSEIKEWLRKAKMYAKLASTGANFFHDGMEWTMVWEDMDEEEVMQYKNYFKKFDENGLDQEDFERFRENIFSNSPFIFRGIGEGGSRKIKDIFIEKNYQDRKSRNPLDSPQLLVNIFDFHFNEKFNVEIRNKGTFTGDYKMAQGYGDIFLFFPIGNFDYYWSMEVQDLYKWSDRQEWYDEIVYASIHPDKANKNYIDLAENDIEDIVHGYKKNNKLGDALSGNRSFEVMFDSNRYYLLNTRLGTGYDYEEFVWLMDKLFGDL